MQRLLVKLSCFSYIQAVVLTGFACLDISEAMQLGPADLDYVYTNGWSAHMAICANNLFVYM